MTSHPRSRPRHRVAFAAATATVLLIVGCSSDNGDDNAPATTSAPASTAATAASTTVAGDTSATTAATPEDPAASWPADLPIPEGITVEQVEAPDAEGVSRMTGFTTEHALSEVLDLYASAYTGWTTTSRAVEGNTGQLVLTNGGRSLTVMAEQADEDTVAVQVTTAAT